MGRRTAVSDEAAHAELEESNRVEESGTELRTLRERLRIFEAEIEAAEARGESLRSWPPIGVEQQTLHALLRSRLAERAGIDLDEQRAEFITRVVKQAAWNRMLQWLAEGMATVKIAGACALVAAGAVAVVLAPPWSSSLEWLALAFVAVLIAVLLWIAAALHAWSDGDMSPFTRAIGLGRRRIDAKLSWRGEFLKTLVVCVVFGSLTLIGVLRSAPVESPVVVLLALLLSGLAFVAWAALLALSLDVRRRLAARRDDPWPWLLCGLLEALEELSHGPRPDGAWLPMAQEVGGPVHTSIQRRRAARVLSRVGTRVLTYAPARARGLEQPVRDGIVEEGRRVAGWLFDRSEDVLRPAPGAWERTAFNLCHGFVAACEGHLDQLNGTPRQRQRGRDFGQVLVRIGIAGALLAAAFAVPWSTVLGGDGDKARVQLVLAAVAVLSLAPTEALKTIGADTRDALGKR